MTGQFGAYSSYTMVSKSFYYNAYIQKISNEWSDDGNTFYRSDVGIFGFNKLTIIEKAELNTKFKDRLEKHLNIDCGFNCINTYWPHDGW